MPCSTAKGISGSNAISCHGFPNSDRERALNTLRYIHANPKAAGMRQSFFYDFSNYGTYENLTTDGITQWHPAFLALGTRLEECARKYQSFCTRYTPKKKKQLPKDWGKRLLRGILNKTKQPKPVPVGQIALPFFTEKIVLINIPHIAETALNFIKANRYRLDAVN